MSAPNWMFATLLGMGPGGQTLNVAFRLCDDSNVGDDVLRAEHLSIVSTAPVQGQPGQFNVTAGRAGGYQTKTLSDPLLIPRSTVAMMCFATKELTDLCQKIWGEVQVAPASALHRLEGRGNNRPPRR